MNFKELGLHEKVLEGIDAMGFDTASPIQELAIPIIKNNSDLIACAQTGTGKTAAYIIPILNKFAHTPTDKTDTLIIVPTRELAIQIDQQLEGMSYFVDISSIAIYGGGDGEVWAQQKNALKKGANVVIATPGRLMSLMNFAYNDFENIKHLVLDEADRMLDMGFHEDIINIIKKLPSQRQTLLFSATMPEKMRSLAKQITLKAEEINIAPSKPAEKILQIAYLVYDKDKIELIKNLFAGKELNSVLIFSATKKNVKQIKISLKSINIFADEIHSDLEQNEREEVLLNFKNKKVQVLVATDILSRGIDINDIDLVINYDVPGDAEDYIHRVGRTARAKSSGIAITFINDKEQNKFKKIEDLIENEILKLPIPISIGESPNYSPNIRSKNNKKRKFIPKREKIESRSK
ncbi:MAG: DEAD/DEAH box helicase [Bacteroidales bacterium]|nr:DEAD/DEAH box helicase [Bacteroidales bacterium]